MNQLTPETAQMYNEYLEWLNEDLNFSDSSVGIYWTEEINDKNISDIMELFPDNELLYFDKHTLIMKDRGYTITIKQVTIYDDSKCIIAEIR